MKEVELVLDGLSVGDAFGQQFFSAGLRYECIADSQAPPGPWVYTDDTEMALGIAEVLDLFGAIEQDTLAHVFVRRYYNDPNRGYGAGAQDALRAIASGEPWSAVSRELFDGQGSLGNGSAMRVAPVGAYFADDFKAVSANAVASAIVTHSHPEGIAGAIAVGVAVGWCAQQRRAGRPLWANEFFQIVIEHTPESAVRTGIELASRIRLDEWEFDVANQLGNGRRITAMDTVPFCLWAAARHLDDYPAALWTTVRVEGDMDTNCAIVGGIVAAAVGPGCIPADWLRAREALQRQS